MKIMESILADDIFITRETTGAAGTFPAFHSHNVYEIYILTSGIRNIFLGTNLYTVTEGDASLIRPHIPHRSYGSVPYSGICIEFSEKYLSGLFALKEKQRIIGCFEKNIISVSRDSLTVLKKRAQDTTNGSFDKREYLLLAASILQESAAGTDDEKKRSTDSDLSQIGSYIQNNYIYIKCLDELAAHFGVSKSYLCRCFKQQTQVTIIEYLNRLKIQHAYKLLQETDLSVSEISVQSGFETVIYFNRVFKKIIGDTPQNARKAAREKWTFLS